MGIRLTKSKFLEKETWVNLAQRTVVTADISYEEPIGEVHRGFNKKLLTPEQLGEAVSSASMDPGDYILEKFPAAGTAMNDRLDFISIDDAYVWVKKSLECGDKVVAWSHETHHFEYQVSVDSEFPAAYEAETITEALIAASISDWEPETMIEADSPKASGLDKSNGWIHLDRSGYGYSNAWLNFSRVRAKRV